jgi:protein-tyrosine-phosphatase
MNAERSTLGERARVHAALGDPARLAIVDRLLLGDASPSELGSSLGLSSNLLAHHVKQLERAGVLERSRSEGDHRRTYLRLRPDALAGLVPAGMVHAPRVVFVCTHNSARSQLAAALWTRASKVPAASAGTEPAERVHPLAVAVARGRGLSLSRARTAHVADVLRPDDLVVAVCDNAHEQLGEQAAERLHWSVPNPTRSRSRDAFDRVLSDLADRVGRLAPAVHLSGEKRRPGPPIAAT